MKLNFSNSTSEEQRVSLKPKSNATVDATQATDNPTLGVDQLTNEVTFCLSPPSFSCAGATSDSGAIYASGLVDIVIDGKVVYSNVDVNDIENIVTGANGVVATKVTPTLTTEVINTRTFGDESVIPEVPWSGLETTEDISNFGIKEINLEIPLSGFDLDKMLFTLNFYCDGRNDRYPVSYYLDDITRENIVETINDSFYNTVEVRAMRPLSDVYLALSFRRNENGLSWLLNFSSAADVPMKVVVAISDVGSGVNLPLNEESKFIVDGVFNEMYSDFVVNPENIDNVATLYMGNVEGYTIDPNTDVAVEDPVATPTSLSNIIVLDGLDHFDVEVNGNLYEAKIPSKTGNDLKRRSNRILSTISALGNSGIKYYCKFVNSRINGAVALVNEAGFPVQVKLYPTSYTEETTVTETTMVQNLSLEKVTSVDGDYYTFWLSAAPEEVDEIATQPEITFPGASITIEEFQSFMSSNTSIYFKFNVRDDAHPLKEYTIIEVNDQNLNPIFRLECPDGIWDYMFGDLLNIAGIKVVDPKWHGITPTDSLTEFVFENINNFPVIVTITTPFRDTPATDISLTRHEYSNNTKRFSFRLETGTLVVPINDARLTSDRSINLKAEFDRKYSPTIDTSDKRVMFIVTKDLIPEVNPGYLTFANGYEPHCIYDHPRKETAKPRRVSGIFIGSVPEGTDDNSYPDPKDTEVRWSTGTYLDSVTNRTAYPGVWGTGANLLLVIDSDVYGLGGTGGNRRGTANAMILKDGGKGYPAIYNHDENDVSLSVLLTANGKLIGGGGGGAATPDVQYTVDAEYEVSRDNGVTWTKRGEVTRQWAPNLGGGGGAPYGLSGVYSNNNGSISMSYSSIGFRPLPSSSSRASVSDSTVQSLFTRNGTPGFEHDGSTDTKGGAPGVSRVGQYVGAEWIYNFTPTDPGYIERGGRGIVVESETVQQGGAAGDVLHGKVDALAFPIRCNETGYWSDGLFGGYSHLKDHLRPYLSNIGAYGSYGNGIGDGINAIEATEHMSFKTSDFNLINDALTEQNSSTEAAMRWRYVSDYVMDKATNKTYSNVDGIAYLTTLASQVPGLYAILDQFATTNATAIAEISDTMANVPTITDALLVFTPYGEVITAFSYT